MLKKTKLAIQSNFPGIFALLRKISIGISDFRNVDHVFTNIYDTNFWEDPSSRSGPGSNLPQTKSIRHELPFLLKEFSIRTMLDIPCGDYYWLKEVNLVLDKYIGIDIVKALIDCNIRRYSTKNISFVHMNILQDELPQVDLIFCRDLLVHFSEKNIFKAINQLKESNSTYLLTTNFQNLSENVNIKNGEWRPLNLCVAPFNFPPPLKIIDEQLCIGSDVHKTMSLWRLSDI